MSITFDSQGFNIPSVSETLNSYGKVSTPLSFHLAFIALVFLRVNFFESDFPNSNL